MRMNAHVCICITYPLRHTLNVLIIKRKRLICSSYITRNHRNCQISFESAFIDIFSLRSCEHNICTLQTDNHLQAPMYLSLKTLVHQNSSKTAMKLSQSAISLGLNGVELAITCKLFMKTLRLTVINLQNSEIKRFKIENHQ